ncbi:hypothetical protein GALL_167370 [mine drainage metagenome]|uniref:Leucine rich repeat variant n=1 Tax=mine drainage metagenome TaxID=410659 RepID=A0A1J5RYQ6_9ZZZZ
MKISLSIDSKESIELSLMDAENVAGLLDDEKYTKFFTLLAEHPSSEVRSAIAFKSNWPQITYRQLARDPSIEVVRNIAFNEDAMSQFKLPLILEMVDRDVSVATNIAEWLHLVNEEVRDEVIQALLQHEDPKVVETALFFKRGH